LDPGIENALVGVGSSDRELTEIEESLSELGFIKWGSARNAEKLENPAGVQSVLRDYMRDMREAERFLAINPENASLK